MNAMPSHREDRRRGVALIIVLGFLSIMIIMAVAFLTQARTERLVAGASLEGMRTRQIAQTAMAAAMQDYLNALKSVSPAEAEHDIFLSGDADVTLNHYYSGQRLGDDRLVIGKVEDWLLANHLDVALGAGEASDDIQNAEWIWVRQEPGSRSRILGRYAYACFDMSGLLDANLLGRDYGDDIPEYGAATNRNNVRKMLYEALSQNKGGNNQLKLNVHQRIWKGFDTPAALLNLTDGTVNDGDDKPENRWEGADMAEGAGLSISSLSSYSYSVLHREDGSGKSKIRCISSSISGEPEFNDILAGGDPNDVLKGMADYESSSAVPIGVDYPSVKNVPMFNEIAVQAGLLETPAGLGTNGLAASTYDLILHVTIEFWYPFPSQDNAAGLFTMPVPSIGGSTSSSGDASIWVQMAGSMAGTLTPLQFGTITTVPSQPLSVSATYGRPYYADNVNPQNELLYTIRLESLGADPLLPPGMSLVVRNVQISQPFVLNHSGSPVDSTPSSKALDFSYKSEAPLVNLGLTSLQSLGVDDPRLNHLFGNWLTEDPPTLGATNSTVAAAKATAKADSGILPGNDFYCRNAPMESPAELGYLPGGTAWQTLDIFSEEGVQLMNRVVCDEDKFDLLSDHNAFFTNGTINPYTRHTNVLNAAFYGLDIREVPNMAGDPEDDERLRGGNLGVVVDAMMLEEPRNGYAGWGRSLASKNFPDELNKNVRISIMNNTWGLFNESDRLFVVVVIAQSIKEGSDEDKVGNWDENDDMITGERRAVALCWMDGSQDVGGDTLTQEMNVLMFQYLNE